MTVFCGAGDAVVEDVTLDGSSVSLKFQNSVLRMVRATSIMTHPVDNKNFRPNLSTKATVTHDVSIIKTDDTTLA